MQYLTTSMFKMNPWKTVTDDKFVTDPIIHSASKPIQVGSGQLLPVTASFTPTVVSASQLQSIAKAASSNMFCSSY
jgi:hypothetical protein